MCGLGVTCGEHLWLVGANSTEHPGGPLVGERLWGEDHLWVETTCVMETACGVKDDGDGEHLWGRQLV